jgi:hypothetical protein
MFIAALALGACSFVPSPMVAAGALGMLLMLLSYILIFALGTATSTGRKLSWSEGEEEDYPVYIATKIVHGTLVNLNATGYAVACTNTTGEVFVGVCMREADNSAGASGDIRVRVRRKGIFDFITSGAAITSIGTDFYATDNQTVQTTANYIYVGKCARYTSATNVGIEIAYATCGIPAPEDTDETVSLPVGATGNIAANDLVYSNAAGYAMPGGTTAGMKLEGIALAAANNSGGLDGAISVSVKRATDPVTHLTTSGAAVTDIGKLVWASGAQAVSLTAGENLAGVIVKYVGATSVYVSLLPALDKPRPGTGDQQCLTFYCYNPTGTATTTFEFPRKAKITRMYLNLATAPGGADTLTATLTDGTSPKSVVCTAAEVVAEDEAPAVTMLADTNCTVTFTDSATTAAGCSLYVWFELL